MLEVFYVSKTNGVLLMKYYLEDEKKVLEEHKTGENGLTSKEAESRVAEHGKNKLKEAEKEVSHLSCVQGRHRGDKRLLRVFYQRSGLPTCCEE